jgi:hypothetical protein
MRSPSSVNRRGPDFSRPEVRAARISSWLTATPSACRSSLFLVDLDALRKALAGQRTLDRQGQLCHRPQIAPLEYEQHEKQRRHECEQHADQPKNRHPLTWPCCY